MAIHSSHGTASMEIIGQATARMDRASFLLGIDPIWLSSRFVPHALPRTTNMLNAPIASPLGLRPGRGCHLSARAERRISSGGENPPSALLGLGAGCANAGPGEYAHHFNQSTRRPLQLPQSSLRVCFSSLTIGPGLSDRNESKAFPSFITSIGQNE